MEKVISKISDAIHGYREVEGRDPDSVAITYVDGFQLLETFTMESFRPMTDLNRVQTMLMKGDRKEITEYLNSGIKVFGLKLMVADVVTGNK